LWASSPNNHGASPRFISGRREGEELLYAGKAGTGFTFETARALREKLNPLVVRKSPLTTPVRKPKATWVRPEVLVTFNTARSLQTAGSATRPLRACART